jgi:serine/threonine protein kinase/Leucine-rich repeat (LRR) protein
MLNPQARPDDALIRKYLSGGLSEAESAEVERYLETSSELQPLPAPPDDTLLSTLRGHAEPTPPDPLRVQKVMAWLNKIGLASDPSAMPTVDPASGTNTSPEADDAAEEVIALLGPRIDPAEMGTLGGYRVVRILGRGGMGVVLEAVDPRLGRRVALKAMRPGLAANQTAKQRFEREAKAAAAVEHDHIVPIYQVGEDRGVLYLAMPFLKGEPLDARLKREGRLPPTEVARLGRQAAEGLAAAHEAGLIHRDIKPGNMWLEAPSGRVKILDFGLARFSSSSDVNLTTSGMVMGTPAYMAPEQANGKPVDGRADLFSLGVVLYRAATGQMPFKGDSTLEIIHSLALDTPPHPSVLNPDVPTALGDLIEKLLAKEPGKRPATAGEVAKALGVIQHDLTNDTIPIASIPTPIVQPLDPWQGIDEEAPATPTPATSHASRKPRNKLFIAGGLLALAAAIAAVVIVIIRDKDGKEVARINVPDGGSVEIKDGRKKETAKDGSSVLRLESVNDTVRLPGLSFDAAKPGTVEFWAERSSPGTIVTLVGKDQALFIQNNSIGAQGKLELVVVPKLFGPGKESLNTVFPAATPDGICHLAACWDGQGTYRFFVNGRPAVNKTENSFAFPQLKESFLGIGDWQKSLQGTLTLHTMRVSSVVRYKDEFVPSKHFSADKETLALYRCDDGQGDVLKDSSGNNRHGKIVGGKWVKVPALGGPSSPEANRKAAEWVLSVGGTVQLRVGDEAQSAGSGVQLPKEQFVLTGVHLPDNSTATNAGLTLLKGCSNLAHLDQLGGDISDAGLAAFKDSKSLTWLRISGAKITDAGLANFQGCKRLTDVWLFHTSTSDAGLGHFKDCKELRFLYLRGTERATLAGVENWNNLASFTAVDTIVTDAGLAWLNECKNLTELVLINAGASDAGLAHFKGRTNLTNLTFGASAVTDVGLANFKGCSDLVRIDLHLTNITDAALEHLRGMTKLAGIGLSRTQIGDTGLAQLAGLRSLKDIDLRQTKVTADGVKKLAAALPGCKIEWDGGVIEPLASPENDRRVAEWVLKNGGKVLLVLDGQRLEVLESAKLPGRPFKLVQISVFPPFPHDQLLKYLPGLMDIDTLELVNTPLTDAYLERLASIAPLASSLQAIRVQSPEVTNAGLAHLKGFIKLRQVSVMCPKVTDEGLAQLRKMSSIRGLSLVGVAITNAGLAHVRDLPLAWLYIGQCPISDAGLEHIKAMSELTKLALADTKITDAGLDVVATLPKLTSLDLSGPSFTDGSLARLKGLKLKHLTQLNVDNAKITDAGLAHLAEMSGLTSLGFNHVPIGDAGLQHLKRLEKLGILSTHGSKVTAEGVKKFAAALPDCRIEWDGGVIEPLASPENDRRVAEWVLKNGGVVHVVTEGKRTEILEVAKLPKGPFPLVQIVFGGPTVELDHLLKNLSGLTGVISLALVNMPVTDTYLERLAAIPPLARSLLSLRLKSDEITDAGLVHLKGFAGLTEFNIASSKITDAGIKHLRGLPHLWNLGLDGVAITDAGLTHVRHLPLAWLHIGRCPISDAGLTHIKAMPGLFRLSLADTEISDAGLDVVATLPKLGHLDLSGKSITDDSLARLKGLKLKSLTQLGVDNCKITDAGLAHVAEMSGLTILGLNNVPIGDAGLQHLKRMEKLAILYLRETKVTADGIKKFAAALPACKITWDGGTIEPK